MHRERGVTIEEYIQNTYVQYRYLIALDELIENEKLESLSEDRKNQSKRELSIEDHPTTETY